MRLEELINAHYKELNENEKYICAYLLEHKQDAARKSIDETASACGVSKTLLVRFAKHIGLSGYRELKAKLRIELQERTFSADDLLQKMTGSYHKMLDDFIKRDDTRLFDSIYHAERVFVYGSGSSQARVASEMKRIFIPEKVFVSLHGHDMCQAIAKNAKTGDLVFIISLSGESESTVQLAETLQQKGVETVSITRLTNNTLASYCSYNLYIDSVSMEVGEYGEYEPATPYFILIELLYLSYQNYLTERESGQSFKK